MKTKTFTREKMDEWAKNRDDGYLDRMSAAIVSQDETDITYDTEHPAYVAEKQRRVRARGKRVQRISDWAGMLGSMAGGAAAIAANALNINQIRAEVQRIRLSICDGCDLNSPCLKGTRNLRCCGGIKGMDPANPGCGCVISQKIRRPGEHCPHPDGPRWNAVQIKTETIDGSIDSNMAGTSGGDRPSGDGAGH